MTYVAQFLPLGHSSIFHWISKSHNFLYFLSVLTLSIQLSSCFLCIYLFLAGCCSDSLCLLSYTLFIMSGLFIRTLVCYMLLCCNYSCLVIKMLWVEYLAFRLFASYFWNLVKLWLYYLIDGVWWHGTQCVQ